MIIFGPSAYNSRNPQANPARLINLFREPGERTLLRSTQGMKARDYYGGVAGDMQEVNGALYAIFGNKLWKNGVQVASVFGGFQQISANSNFVTMVSGGHYLVWDDRIAEPGKLFNEYGSLAFLAGRTVVSELGGNRFQWSDIGDPATLSGLNVATAEQRDDSIVRLMNINGSLMVFGERSTEIWGVTGNAGSGAFRLLPGAVVDTGLKAAGLAVDIGGAAFIVAHDGIAYLAASTQWLPVSTPGVNAAITDGTPTRCLTWSYSGHKFAAIVFADRPAWVYDLATKEWFERSEGMGEWDIAMSCQFGAGWLFGSDDGNTYDPVSDGTDKGLTLFREATSGIIEQQDFFTINEIEFGASYGLQTVPASLLLETSRDGSTWSRQGSVDVGQDGDFARRAVFRRLGTSRKRAFRLTLADACDFSIYADAKVK